MRRTKLFIIVVMCLYGIIATAQVPYWEVESTANLIVLHPHNEKNMHMELVCGDVMPDSADCSILFCAAAAFTKEYNTPFSHDKKVMGQHISNHRYYAGAEVESDYTTFVWNKGNYELTNWKLPTEWDRLAEQGAFAFTQHYVVRDGKLQPFKEFNGKSHEYRVLAITADGWCIISGNKVLQFDAFCASLLAYRTPNGNPIMQAIYMDMGALRYSYYRDRNGKVVKMADCDQKKDGCNWWKITK